MSKGGLIFLKKQRGHQKGGEKIQKSWEGDGTFAIIFSFLIITVTKTN